MQERCIGCKTYVVVCPYGAMEVVVRPTIRNGSAGLNVRTGKVEANKCDLRNHCEDGPACVVACPIHASTCVDRNKLEQLSAEKCRRTALTLQKSYRTASISKELPEIFIEYEVGSIADL